MTPRRLLLALLLFAAFVGGACAGDREDSADYSHLAATQARNAAQNGSAP